jgi:hypothetical protein
MDSTTTYLGAGGATTYGSTEYTAAAQLALPYPTATLPTEVPPKAGEFTKEVLSHLHTLGRKLREAHELALTSGDEVAARRIALKLRETERMATCITGTLSGASDITMLLQRQPSETQLRLPGRLDILKRKARARLEHSKFAFPDPDRIPVALRTLVGDEDPGDFEELEHRIMHYLAEGNLVRDGLGVAAFLNRLIVAGIAVAAGDGGEKLPVRMREILLDFLIDARAGKGRV